MTKKLLGTLIAGVMLGATAPVFADSFHHDRGYDRHSYSRDYDRHSYSRGYDRHSYFRGYDHHGYRDDYAYRGYSHRPVVVYERPYVVQRPVYVEQPVYQSQQNLGIGAILGAAIGGIYDSRQQ